jgi:type IV secretion system protein VirB4
MLRLAPLTKNFRETGALNESVPFFGYIDDHTFLTKAGDLGVVLELTGIDYEGLDGPQMDYRTKRLEAALKLLGPGYRVYQILFKRNYPSIPHYEYENPVVNAAIAGRVRHFEARADRLFTIQIYYVILYQRFRHKTDFFSAIAKLPRSPSTAFRELQGLFSAEKQIKLVLSAIDRAHKPLRRTADNFALQLGDFVDVRLLPKGESFIVLKRLLNFDPRKIQHAHLKHDVNLDFFLCDSHIECHPDHLKVDDHHVRVLTLKDATSQSWPLILKPLYEVPANYHVVMEWSPIDNEKAKPAIQTHRRHFHNTKISFMSTMSAGNVAGTDVLVDDSKAAIVGRLADLKKEIELNGNYLGQFALTMVVYDRDPAVVEKAAAEFYKVFSVHDGAVYEETYNQLNAFFATLPGNYHHNVRYLNLLNTNYADYSFLFTLHTGDRENPHLGREYLAVLETTHETPYYLNLHHHDIAHTLILGMTGSGKSFLLNFLITNAQKYDPYTFIFDLGGSYKGITRLLEGSYLRVGIATQDFTINPFSLPRTKENLHFLFSFVKVLIEGNDPGSLDTAQDKELYQAIERLYEVDANIRRLRTLAALLPKQLGSRLAKWIQGGQYETIFDNEQDTLTFGRFQCLDFEGMDQYPEIIQPLLFYVLHRANNVIYDPAVATTFKAFVMDEAWRFFQHPTIRNYIVEALKTWRKKHAALILATQSLDELAKSDILHIVNESCPTKIFLANPEMDRELYRDTFHLNETELELIKGLIPKRQFLLKRPDYAKVLNLQVDPKSYWIYTNNPADNYRRDEVIATHGFEKGLEILAGESS